MQWGSSPGSRCFLTTGLQQLHRDIGWGGAGVFFSCLPQGALDWKATLLSGAVCLSWMESLIGSRETPLQTSSLLVQWAQHIQVKRRKKDKSQTKTITQWFTQTKENLFLFLVTFSQWGKKGNLTLRSVLKDGGHLLWVGGGVWPRTDPWDGGRVFWVLTIFSFFT